MASATKMAQMVGAPSVPRAPPMLTRTLPSPVMTIDM